MRNYYILTFENTYNAMNGEDTFKKENVKCVVMPTPTSITKSCGICLGFEDTELSKVTDLIKSNVLEYKGLFMKSDAGYEKVEI